MKTSQLFMSFALIATTLSSGAAMAGSDLLFSCTTEGGGTVQISADKDMRLATIVVDSSLTSQIKPGLELPKYLHVQPIDGDAKPGDKSVSFNSTSPVPASITQSEQLTASGNTLWFNLHISFSADERAGKKLQAGAPIAFSPKNDPPKISWMIFNELEQPVRAGAQSRLEIASIAITSCVAGPALSTVNDVDAYETH